MRRFVLFGLAVAAALGPAAPPVVAASAAEPTVLVGAADIADCTKDGDSKTADLLDGIPGTVFAVGDLVQDGTTDQFHDCYGPTWGRHFDRTMPAVGNREYETPGAMPYFDYFGAAAGEQGKGWYSYDFGTWHVVVLNSMCHVIDCDEGSEQERWLRADLAAADAECIAAFWHHPRFTSGYSRGGSSTTGALFEALYDHGADLLISGHTHFYERFARQDPRGRLDATGVRQFIAGTGGHAFTAFHSVDTPAQHSEVRNNKTNGVLKLTLRAGDYDWQFVPVAGQSFTDAGTDTCTPGAEAEPPPDPDGDTDGDGDGDPDGDTDGDGDQTGPGDDSDPEPGDTGTDPGPDPDGDADEGGQPTTPHVPAGGSGTTGEQKLVTPGPGPVASTAGYWALDASGAVYAFGAARPMGPGTVTPAATAVDIEPTPAGDGYWILDSTGAVSAVGTAARLGGVPPRTLRPGETASSLSATPSGRGYWIFTTRGRAVRFGDAPLLGDLAGTALNGPVLDSVATRTGRGYWMVASDGGIFAFGDAAFSGSMGSVALNAPVQSLVPDPDGTGYWLVASDGGVFAFAAGFVGSMGGQPVNAPVTGMVAYGTGYLMVATDGGVFNFSNRPFAGSLGDRPPAAPVMAVAALP